uniref:Uncharacterized protein n=1 Tax=Leptocylindrus danicus TaxID=163516 RepID=A0A7S2PRP2_9STRA|mmetsp:Transcript_9625/g.14463  ORF Transcript_9625/g.14463 Transcript_9625/m.14463 type:complete len:188 (+) Transcript_9625:96-659(+)
MRRHSRRNVKSVGRVAADAPAPAYDHRHESSSSSYYPGSSLTLPLASDHNFTQKPYVSAGPLRMISDVSLSSQYDDFPQSETPTVDLSYSFNLNISKSDKFGNLNRDACAVHVPELSDDDPLEPFPVEQDIASPSRSGTNWNKLSFLTSANASVESSPCPSAGPILYDAHKRKKFPFGVYNTKKIKR